MFKRDLPIILFGLVFCIMLYVLASVPRYVAKIVPVVEEKTVEVEPEPAPPYFKGCVRMPTLDDIYVLNNTAGRDISRLEKFLQGRSAGLHWLGRNYYQKLKKAGDKKVLEDVENVLVGLRLAIDSLGQVDTPEILFSNSRDAEFDQSLLQHIVYYWKFPKSLRGKTEVWIPIVWLAQY